MKNIGYILVGLLFVAGIVWLIVTPGKPGQYDEFATCLKDKGAIFYGAFWCPHCRDQKDLFGKSSRLLPYVECSTPDGNSQMPACNEKGIKSYPTWYFPTTTPAGFDIVTGVIEFPELAQRTGCVLPK